MYFIICLILSSGILDWIEIESQICKSPLINSAFIRSFEEYIYRFFRFCSFIICVGGVPCEKYTKVKSEKRVQNTQKTCQWMNIDENMKLTCKNEEEKGTSKKEIAERLIDWLKHVFLSPFFTSKWINRLYDWIKWLDRWIEYFYCNGSRCNVDVTLFFSRSTIIYQYFYWQTCLFSFLNDSIRFANTLMQKWCDTVDCVLVRQPVQVCAYVYDLLSNHFYYTITISLTFLSPYNCYIHSLSYL